MMKKILIAPVRLYQKFISPAFPPSCRYQPTCSNYMIQAIEKYGVPDVFSLKRNYAEDKERG